MRLAITDGGNVVLAGANLSAADVDDSNATLLFSVTNLSGGQFELLSNPGVGVGSFTQAQLSAGQVQFVHDGSGIAPAYAVSVSDGTLVDGPAVATISFGGTGVTPPAPDIDPLPDVKPPPKVEPPVDTDGDDEDEPDSPPEDEAPAPSATGGETETDTLIEGVPGGRTTLAAEALVLPAFVIDAPLDRDRHLDNDPGSTDSGIQNTLQKTLKAITTRPPGLQALLGGISTAYGLSWGDFTSLESEEYRQQLDRLRDDVADDLFMDQTVVGSGIAASTAGLSVGYVLWLVRGGVLLSSVLSSLPAWRLVDPLPVLAYVKNRPEDEDDPGDGESLESLVKKKAPRSDKHSDEEHSE